MEVLSWPKILFGLLSKFSPYLVNILFGQSNKNISQYETKAIKVFL